MLVVCVLGFALASGCGGDTSGSASAPVSATASTAVEIVVEDSGPPQSEEDVIRRTVDAFYTAFFAGDEATACALMSPEAVGNLTASGGAGAADCAGSIEQTVLLINGLLGEDVSWELSEVSVSGTRGTGKLTLRVPNSQTGRTEASSIMTFDKVDGDWLVGPDFS